MDGVADVMPGQATGSPGVVAAPPAQPVAGGAERAGLRSRLWPMLRTFLWIGIPATVSAALVLFVVKPTEAPPPDEGVAAAWNDSIGRLGVWPIYPPEEDFYVGDLWAVLLVNDPSDKNPGIARVETRPILATAARIGHIDLTGLLRKDEARRVRFVGREPRSEVASGPAGEGDQGLGSSPTDGVRPSLVAFPGVTISNGRKVATSFGSDWFGWGASNDGSFSDEIHITDASTYGVPLGEAFGAMLRWCSSDGEAVCSDEYARRVLAQAGISGTLEVTSDGSAFENRIELRLITRAFLARTIDQKRSADGARGLAARTSSDGAPATSGAPQSPTTPAGDGSPTSAGRGQALAATADAARNGASFVTVRSNGATVEIKKTTYERPLVFGYRAASMLLEPMAPEKGTKP